MSKNPDPNTIIEPDWSFIPDADRQNIAREHWNVIVAEMREAGTLSAANVAQIKRYIVALLISDDAAAGLLTEGAVRIANKKTGQRVANPRWLVFNQSNAIAADHEMKLGLTPKGRKGASKTAAPKKAAAPADKHLKL